MVTAERYRRVTVTASLDRPAIAIVTGRIGAAVAALHISGCWTVLARLWRSVHVETTVLKPARRDEIDTNFLTADGEYFVTADGKVFYVMED